FLFTGTRGVGKTTIARILSKSLNCDTGITSKPCGECSACLEIDEGRFVDLIEVDAASRTKVEDTRELLENVQYAPTRGRYKVYLIDEVHMLSNHSFNALLKTLEEPPPHVKFLLATTDPQKLPVTILSRCLQFNLKKLPLPDIVSHLAHILQQEALEFDEPALRLIARGAEGSMRDALSLMDQAIAFGGGRVGDEDVRHMLGTIESTHVYQLIEQVHRQDGKAVLQTISELDVRSPDYQDVLAEMISVYHHIALEQQVAGSMTDEWDDPQRIQQLAGEISPEDVQLYYQTALQGRDNLKMNPLPREGFEMTLLRMIAFRPWQAEVNDSRPATQPVTQARPATVADNQLATDTTSPASTSEQPVAPTYEPAEQMPAPVQEVKAAASNSYLPDWQEILDALNLKAMALQLAENCQLEVIEDDIVRLILDQPHARLLTDSPAQKIEEALSDFFGKPIKLKVQPGIVPSETPAQRKARQDEERQKAAVASIEGDENVQMMKEMFGATVAADAIQPVED
ncbi:MAG: DNA polymerase III subunit gamma/tau, partial [Gammaproteobacteria bacterium]|nr:DNA polymerase III subunit gamma/tau [Gammaproteobacteria bacterium]